jgi:putative membrane protein insertion efficiency factor
MTSPLAHALIAPIRFYQRFITPYTPATCRYYPTCSAYAVTALRTHGALIGTGLTIWRILRCNPWSSGGIDRVPARGQLWHRHSGRAHTGEAVTADGNAAVGNAADGNGSGHPEEADHRERDGAAASSTTVSSAEARSAGTDLDPPRIAAGDPMIGRSAA